MPIVSTSSLPLFAFSNDGTVAWLREAGSRLVAVDPRTGVTLREVHLDPVPFGIGWRIERHGSYFVVRDDHEIAAYDDTTGLRVWKRTDPTDVAIAGEREKGGHVSVLPEPGGEGISIALADLATGAFDKKLRVDASMKFVGTHGTLAGDLLFFATDEREVYAIDVANWEIAQHHRIGGAYLLPPVTTAAGVHVASIEHRDSGTVTHVTTLDRTTGFFISSHELPGAAHSMTAGTSGLVLEARQSANGPVERIAFRPDAPSVRLRVAKHVDLQLVRDDAPRLDPHRAAPELPSGGPPSSGAIVVENAPPRSGGAMRAAAAIGEARHDEMIPAARDGSEARPSSGRDGLLGLLALLDARSEIIPRLADAFDGRSAAIGRLQRFGITLRDPRVRWSSTSGRDPCLLDIAENREGDAIATYLYPKARSEAARVPVVLVARDTGEARWLADDFDAWFAGVLYNAAAYAPEAVRTVLLQLGLPSDLPRPLPKVQPPPWFFEAHITTWTLADADAAMAAGDIDGAERMLVAVGRSGQGAAAKDRLAAIYAQLRWDHHRATVAETW